LFARLQRRRHELVYFHAASKPAFFNHFVHFMNKVKTGFWQTVLRGYGQNAIQIDERKGIL
jgi:hypothetical protein